MSKKQQEVKYEKWRILVEEQEKSGLSQAAFCREKQVVFSHFCYYRSRIKEKTVPRENLFSPIHFQKHPTASDLQIILPNGLKCVLPCATDVAYVRQIVGVLLSC